MGIPIASLSAMVSNTITAFYPLRIKIDKVIDKRTYEISPLPISDTQIFNVQQAWDGCECNISLTPDEKERIYLQYHRSHNCYPFVQMFALALKKFCDEGMTLTHGGKPVVDIWVLNTDDFDVADIQDSFLTIKDTETGCTLLGMSTYKNIDILRQQSANVRRRFSLGLPETTKKCEDVKRQDSYKYLNSAPHWWIAAIVEEVKSGVKMRRMIHIDICGAAFDESGFYRHNKALVSLHIVETPEFDLFPVRDLPNIFKAEGHDESFVMRPYYRVSSTDRNYRYAFLRPWSFRHFRPYHWKDSSHLKAIPLASFVSRSQKTDLVMFSKLIDISLRGSKLHLPAGMKVSIRSEGILTTSRTGTDLAKANLQFVRGSNLKERTGCVHDCIATQQATCYVPVSVSGFIDPIWVNPQDLQLTTKKWYSSYSELVKTSERFRGPNPQCVSAAEWNAGSSSKEDQAAVESAMSRNKDLNDAFSSLVLGKISHQFILDQYFMTWVRRLLLPPFSKVLSAEDIWRLKGYIAVSEFQRVKDAWEMLADVTAAKSAVIKNRMVGNKDAEKEDENDAIERLASLTKVAKEDGELMKFYKTMDELGLWNSPFP